MSITTESNSPAAPPSRPMETAPSQTVAPGPTLARMVGFVGLFALVLGSVVVVTNMILPPRWISTGWGYLFAALGVALLMYHAVSDTEQEVRRMYGLLAALWLILGLIASIAPGPVFTSGVEKSIGYNLLPWGVGFGFLSLIFAVPFVRQETDEQFRRFAETVLLVVGGLLVVGSVFAGLIHHDFLVGPSIALALLGLGFLAAYLGQVDTSEGIGYWVAFSLGALGSAIALYALGAATIPTLFYDGPGALRKPNGDLDKWAVLGRLILGCGFAALVAFGARSKRTLLLRSAAILIGLVGVVVLVIASFKSNLVTSSPKPFLVPTGVILLGLGIVYLAVSLGVCSDNQFLALTRRELASYFLSPVGYLVIGLMAFAGWQGYMSFVGRLASGPRPEPIVQNYFVDLLPVIFLLLEVPALTMRLIAEEKRAGTLEVLLTAPVNETPIVMSKFLATWIFFLITWVPAGLFLIALRVEGGVSFDYRPLLSFYLALAAQGVAFIGIGLFFSTITRDQIVAAVLMFVTMGVFLGCYLVKEGAFPATLPQGLQTFLGRLSFIHMWIESLSGQLPLRDVLVFVSTGVFFLYLSVKVLEIRKWS